MCEGDYLLCFVEYVQTRKQPGKKQKQILLVQEVADKKSSGSNNNQGNAKVVQDPGTDWSI